VNVALIDASGTRSLLHVPDEDHCADATLGWHYDVDPATGNATKIVACKHSCDTLKAATDARIELRLGCPTLGPE
jgi:hypothetical protein